MKRGAGPPALSLLLTIAISGCGESPSAEPNVGAARDFSSFVTQTEAPFESALGDFDAASARRDPAACRVSARRALEAARAARDEIERHSVPEALVPARREELTFLNHAVPGFQAFLAGDLGPAEVGKVREILIRGRSHQSRARAWLREAGAGPP